MIVDGLDEQTHAALEGQGDATNDSKELYSCCSYI